MYGLYLAEIVSDSSESDSRLQVRPLPQMENIPSTLCPVYPYFFRDEALTGKTGELVWIVSNTDFTVGYVLGPANYNTYSYQTGVFEDQSIPVDLKQAINDSLVQLKSEKLSFVNLKVTFWNEDCIHFIERSNGGFIIAYRSGAIHIFKESEVLLRIGNSKIYMNSDTITIAADSLNLQSESVGLGRNPTGSVLITAGTGKEAPITSEYVRA